MISGTGTAIDGVWLTNSKSDNKWGWSLGLGTEYAITQNLSVKAEYLHYDLGTVKSSMDATDLAISNGSTPGSKGISKVKVDGDIVRIGLNYKF